MNKTDIGKVQLDSLQETFDQLHQLHGDSAYKAIYGAGCTKDPEVCLIFMNPTARNISAHPKRSGLRAPRVGLKQTWKMLYDLGFISQEYNIQTQTHPSMRSEDFVLSLYKHVSDNKVFITNLAKCTQSHAKHLPDSIFKEYLPSLHREIKLLQPKKIITFGNQVSSIMLGKAITVSSYHNDEFEAIEINNQTFHIYPCRYPVGMGFRNSGKAKERIKNIINN